MRKLTDQEQTRREKLAMLQGMGREPYPARVGRTHQTRQLLAAWRLDQQVVIAGRVRASRLQGGSAFLKLEDETGPLQVFLQKKNLADFSHLIKLIDLGDFLEVGGTTFVTKRGERTVDATSLRWLTKAVRPLPSEWHGLADVETRYRYRELDTLANPVVKDIFLTRSTMLNAVRQFLVEREFVEVETPVLQPIPGGATARPFVTHHQALDLDLYLRVAPELYLKRLIVGGFGRVFEIGRNFRNEGIDRDHNPEFTMMECYAAYTDYEWMLTLTEDLMIELATAIKRKPEITLGQKTFKLKKPFKRIAYREAILHTTKIDIDQAGDDQLRAQGRNIGTDLPDDMSRSKMIDEIFKTHVRSNFIEPTFVIDFPVELSPLAKRKPNDTKYVERFQLLADGTELGNAFSELNDPAEQRQRFEAQERLRQKGDTEAQPIDESYIRSLEYGLPPTSGLGIGIDRLTALLTNQKTLKDVILFPTLKPEQP
ncbi:MAG: lysine--tRNA ligase [Candidatus Kerfeldbacteria bacterium]|nr:lysine--tRNA ligase [Candidatus Kerfeldbacteria bacterium]